MRSKSKPFYRSRTLWGLLLSLGALVSIGLADAGTFEMLDDFRTQLMGVSFVGLGLAGWGRVRATEGLGLKVKR